MRDPTRRAHPWAQSPNGGPIHLAPSLAEVLLRKPKTACNKRIASGWRTHPKMSLSKARDAFGVDGVCWTCAQSVELGRAL